MRTTRAEIVVRVALLKQPRKPLSKRANVVRNILRASFKELQKFYEPIFDRSRDALLKRLRRPALRNVPTHRHPIGELALGFLIASLAAPTDGPNVE